MKRPAFQFYPSDWRKDTALQFCSLAARGLWVEMMCIAHECEPYGYLVVNGKPMTIAQIGRLVGIGERECNKLLAELFDAGVPSKTEEGAIFSRRMVRDEEVRNKRAAGGYAGASHGDKGASHGAKGGRPAKQETPLKTPLDDNGRGVSEPPLKPPPSSSSSSSENLNPSSLRDAPPLAKEKSKRPKGVTLTAWLADVKAKGERAVSEHAPLWDYCRRVGIPAEWVEIAWARFVDRYQTDEKSKRKTYTDWRRVFVRAVEDNWFGLWFYSDREKAFRLTTTGIASDLATREAA